MSHDDDGIPLGRRILVVDHYLLLESPELLALLDRIVFLSPWAGVTAPPFPVEGSQADMAARETCSTRRSSRKSGRSAAEAEPLRMYYERAVWPAFRKFTAQSTAVALKRAGSGLYRRIAVIDATVPIGDLVATVTAAARRWCLEMPIEASVDTRLATIEWSTLACGHTIACLRSRLHHVHRRLAAPVETATPNRSGSGGAAHPEPHNLDALRRSFSKLVLAEEGEATNSGSPLSATAVDGVLVFLAEFATLFAAKKFKYFIAALAEPMHGSVSSASALLRCLWLSGTIPQTKQKAITSILIGCLETASVQSGSAVQRLGISLVHAIVARADCVAHISPAQQVKLLRHLAVRGDGTAWLQCDAEVTAFTSHVQAMWTATQLEAAALQFERELGCSGYIVPRCAALAGLAKSRDLSTLQWYAGDAGARRDAINVATTHSPTFAKALASEWRLLAEFPKLGWLAFRYRLSALVKKKNGQMAATMCGVAVEHHAFLVEELVRTQQLKAAREVRDILVAMSAESQAADVDIPDAANSAAATAAAFLRSPLPAEALILVDNHSTLAEWERDVHALTAAPPSADDPVPVAALDAEWKPSFGKKQNPPSLLQVGFRHRVYILDLLRLMPDAGLRTRIDVTIATLFQAEWVLKLGVAFEGDLKLLRASFPDLRCFDQCHNLLDGGLLLQAHVGHLPLRRTKKRTTGLAAIVRGVLGQELDKACQCSNWEVRPLTREQFNYAALDTISLVLCLDHIIATNPAAAHAAINAADLVAAGASPQGHPTIPLLTHKDVALAINGCPGAALIDTQDIVEGDVSVGKTLAFKTGNGSISIVCTRGDLRIDVRKLGKATGARCRLLGTRQCATKLGYAPGSIPPVGHRTKYPCYVDAEWFQEVTAAAGGGRFALGGGSPLHTLVLDAAALVALTDCTLVDLRVSEVDERAPTVEDGGAGFAARSTEYDGEQHRFLATIECNRLARWLRVVGIDVTTPPDLAYEDLFALAREERRLILTCNKQLAARRDAMACYLLEAHDVESQFQTIIAHFDIKWCNDRFMSVCSKCNTRGFHGPCSAADVLEQYGSSLPPKVRRNIEHFWVCRNAECRRVYWVGRKYADADDKFRKFLEGGEGSNPPAQADMNHQHVWKEMQGTSPKE